MPSVTVDGRRIAYRTAGSGEALVLLHGGLADSRSWRRELDAFSDTHHVIAWDAPGCGQSFDPPSDTSLDDYADWVAGLLDALGIDQAHLLGHSFGGGLALAVAIRHARLVRSLILVSAYAGWAGSLSAEEVDARRRWAERSAQQPARLWVDGFLETLFDETTPPSLVEQTRAIMLDTRPTGMLAMAHAFAAADLTDGLGDVAVPTLLLYGDEDRRSSGSIAEAMHAAMPASRLEFIGGAGHEVPLEAPDAFDHEVRRFLRDL